MEHTTEGTWLGGYVRVDRHGRPVWVIREQHKGKRYTIALAARSEEEAKAQLALFRQDRAGYEKRARAEATEPVYLDDDRLLAFLTWSRDEKENTPTHVHAQKTYLLWWMERLAGIDLRGDLKLSKLT
ncbi:MAG TPA: hypothetical protein VFG53_12030, partial [Anaeromyxobacter sp.]|nr:hypothetical protein [Anaeromyxobacter sp.]